MSLQLFIEMMISNMRQWTGELIKRKKMWKGTINQSCNYGISFVLLPTRLINNLFQLMTNEENKNVKKLNYGDKKVFIYILVYFYWFLNASTIIKIGNHLVRFTSQSIKRDYFFPSFVQLVYLKAGVVKYIFSIFILEYSRELEWLGWFNTFVLNL